MIEPSPHIAHVTMPLATDGSSIAHVVRALTREHRLAGGRSTVVTSHNRSSTFPDADVVPVDYTRHCPREYFTPREYLLDAALGGLLITRPHGARIFEPAVEALRELKPDWVVLHEGHYAATALPMFRRSLPGARIALYVHNALSRSCLRHELTRLVRSADLVIGVSDYMCDQVTRRAWIDGSKVRRVYNGADLARFTPGPAARAPGVTRLVYVGQVAPHKGVHLVVEALAALGSRAANFELVIVGSSQNTEMSGLSQYELDLRAKAAHQRAKVEFRPYVPQQDLPCFYRHADAVVVPSIAEPFGMVPLEAMACGALVIANNAGALPEVIGESGILVEPSVQGWVSALQRLDEDDQVGVRDRALRRAALFTWHKAYTEFRRSLDESPTRR